jgi:hypothetical protein
MAPKKSSEQKAWEIIDTLKHQVIEILWNDNRLEYTNEHLLIPWIQEETEYAIKKLKLPAEKEAYFIEKIDHIIGEYTEEV